MQLSSATAPTRRRPSGEPPPLPRTEGWGRWLVLLGIVFGLGVVASILLRSGVREPAAEEQLRAIREWAPTWLTDLAARFDVLGSVWVVLVVAALYKRWRQAVVFLATIALTDFTVVRILGVQRPAPTSVTPTTDRATFWFPSRPAAALTVTAVAMVFVLIPAGRARKRLGTAAALLGIAYAFARVLNAGDYAFDAAYAVAFAAVAPVVAFFAFVPDEVFPVRYSRRDGPSAHLDLSGARTRAIVEAVREQLGFTVVGVRPFGLEGSGGSSPAMLTIEEPPGRLFVKIFNTNHVRADRWYRYGRTLLYGRLEDEVPFGSVRRLVEYEDYALRLLDDVGIRVAHPYGVVELTPHREYMLVTEFFEHAEPLTEAAVNDVVVDDGLQLVRTFWDHGLAHRDIKPANLLARDGRLQLVDVSGLEVRASSWRQAVDLANMMLTLALRTDPDRVYARAVRVFEPEEIAEAFASDQGLAVPTQLQSMLREDPRPIFRRFTELAPRHDPVSIQRWSVRRTAALVGTATGALVAATMLVDALLAGLR
jgi:tRNA A-37 threonylcarbamoyl transferase component Bud32